MNMVKVSKKVLCMILATTMINPTIAFAVNNVSKNETVYVNLDQSGNTKNEIVTDWIHSNAKDTEVNDKSDLKNIVNVKGDEAPIINGENITWKLKDSDLYYTGTTDKKLPLDVKIKYYLDGQEIGPKDLGGKTGKIKIDVQLTNTQGHDVMISGKKEVIYTPIIAAVTMDLPMDTFKNVVINKGKILSEGDNQIITFLALPGLKDSLNLDSYGIEEIKSIEFPEELIITADVVDFKMGPIGIAATSELPKMDNIKKSEEIDKIREDLKDLANVQSYIDKIDPDNNLKSLITNSQKIAGSRCLINDAFTFYAMDKSLINVIPQYITQENISLYDKVKNDIKNSDIDYILNNATIKSMPERLNNQNIENSRRLISDADTIKGFDTSKLDGVIDILNNYSKMKSLINSANNVLVEIGNNTSSLDTLNKLSKYSSSVSGLLNNLNTSGIDMLSETDIMYGFQKALENKELQTESLIDSTDPALKANLIPIVDAVLIQQENLIKNKAIDADSLNIINQALLVAPDNQDLLKLKGTTSAFIAGQIPDSQKSVVEQAIKAGVISILENQKNILENAIKADKTPDIAKLQVRALVKAAFSAKAPAAIESIKKTLDAVTELKGSLQNDLGSDYQNDINQSINFIGSLMPDINNIEVEAQNNKADINKVMSLISDEDNIKYLKDWSYRLEGMKKDLDANQTNIDTLRELLKVNDDPKINNFKKNIDTLQSDINEVKPIVESLNDRLNNPILNKCLYNSPNDVKKLITMEKDLEDNRQIIESLRDAVQQDNIDRANQIVTIMDKVKSQNIVEDSDKKLNSLDELIARKDELVKLSESSNIFTQAGENMNTNIKFIIKTDEIKKPEVVQVKKEIKNEETGIFNWIKAVFSKIVSAII